MGRYSIYIYIEYIQRDAVAERTRRRIRGRAPLWESEGKAAGGGGGAGERDSDDLRRNEGQTQENERESKRDNVPHRGRTKENIELSLPPRAMTNGGRGHARASSVSIPQRLRRRATRLLSRAWHLYSRVTSAFLGSSPTFFREEGRHGASCCCCPGISASQESAYRLYTIYTLGDPGIDVTDEEVILLH